MNRTLAAALACALPFAAAAETSITVYSSARPGTLSPQAFRNGGDGTAVPGYALVRDDRTFDFKPGRNRIRLSDVPAWIDPTTVSFTVPGDAHAARVVEQSFEFDLTNRAKLLSKYLDREITVEQARGDKVEAYSGTLLGTQGGIVLKDANGGIRIVDHTSSVKLPSLPGGLISKPTLAWDVDAPAGGSQRARIAYQTGGMTWWTDYNLTYSEAGNGGCRLDVGAWVTLVNQSGATFTDARLKLIAGDVQRAQPQREPQVMYAMAPRAAEAKSIEGFAEKAFFEYHLYTLGRTTTLPDNATKQIELVPVARGVGCQKALVYQGQLGMGYYGGLVTDRNYGSTSNKKVDVYLRLRNAQGNGLGVPLPAGRVRVSKLDPGDGSLEFIGEDLIDHTARDEMVQVKLGSAFDVVGERKQVDFRLDTSAKWMEEDVEIRLRNQKPDEAVTVIAKESMYRWSQWTLTRRTHDFTKDDARTVLFPVKLAPKAEAVIRYTVRYTW